jgi:predicted GNAT family N-acyltransferase
MTETFRISRVTWEKHGADLSAVRLAVFVDEQKFRRAEALDGRDPDCVHVAALDQKGATIGIGRMMADGHIGRMAVMPPWRGRGVGTAVIHELLAIAKERCLPQVDLDAQIHAIPFYERLGFAKVGEEFLEAGAPHRKMMKKIGA